MIWPDPTHLPSHPPNNTPTHGWGGLHKFQQNWNILNSSSVIEFLLILGVPPGGWGGGWMGMLGGAHAHAHVCTHTCVHVWHHSESLGFSKSKGDSILQLKLSRLTCICGCVCMHACACVCTCVGAPQTTPTNNQPPPPSTQPHLPELQGAQNTKIQCLELIKIFWLCLKILYLRTLLNSYRL